MIHYKVWEKYLRDGGDWKLEEHGITPANSILTRARQLRNLLHNNWKKREEEIAQRRAARELEEERRWKALLADATIPTRAPRLLQALFCLPPERFESPQKLREGLEEGRKRRYHELDRENGPLRYIWNCLRPYELRGRNAETDEKLLYIIPLLGGSAR